MSSRARTGGDGGHARRSGARLAFDDGTPDILAYPKDRAAYGRLCRILTAGNLRAPKGECQLRSRICSSMARGCRSWRCPSSVAFGDTFSRKREKERAPLPLAGEGWGEGETLPPPRRLRRALWIGASLTYGEDMRGALAQRAALAKKLGAPLLATNDALMHAPERRALADVVACIRERTTLEAAGRLTQANAERHLKAPREMARLFAEAPEAVEETIRFLDGLAFSLDELAHRYPEELREGFRDAAGRARSLRPRRREGALSRRRPGARCARR